MVISILHLRTSTEMLICVLIRVLDVVGISREVLVQCIGTNVNPSTVEDCG